MKTLYALVLVTALAACGKKGNDKPADPPAGSGSAVTAPVDTPPVAAGSGSAGSGSAAVAEAPVDVPTEMDYEDLANEEITDKTVEARLKALETDLAPQ